MLLTINVLADVIHLLKIVVLCDLFFLFQRRDPEHKGIYLGIASVVVSAISLCIHIFDYEVIELFVYIIAIILILYVLYREKATSVVFVAIWSVVALSLIDTMISAMLKKIIALCNIDEAMFLNFLVAVISLALVYTVGRMYRKSNTAGLKTMRGVKLFWFTLLMVADYYVVTLIAIWNFEINVEPYGNLYLLAIVLVIIGIFIQLGAVVILLTQRNVYKEKEELTQKYLEEQKSHYEYLEEREKETKKFRHDFRSHMELISSLARKHEYDKIDEYLEQMQIKVEELGNNVTVQNGIVDAILNQYYAKAVQYGIKMDVKGRFPIDFQMDVYDICTIFSNILSNAIEAAMDAKEKYVSVECRYNERNIIIAVKNSFCSEGKNSGTWLQTQKADLDFHGFGLENIKDSVKKYNGVYNIDMKDDTFTLSIVFSNAGK